MKQKKISKIIFNPKVRDFTYLVLFFFIFSFFIIFAIRPALVSIFSLKKEEEDLKRVNLLYDSYIAKIIDLQSAIEKNRDDLPLLSQAIPDAPKINNTVEDIKNITEKNSIIIKNLSFSDIDLSLVEKNKIKNAKINFEGRADFRNLMDFIKELFDQRRLKEIKKLVVKKNLEGTSSAQLEINLIIESSYF